MRSYDGARGIFSFLELLAWAAVVIGVIVAFVGANEVSQYAMGGGLVAALPGVIMSFAGFLVVAVIQNARATVDTAEYTQQMLKIARDQLEVSRQALSQGNQTGKSFAGNLENQNTSSRRSMYESNTPETKLTNQPAPSIEREIIHQGHTIQEIEERFHVDGKDFAKIKHAQLYVDSILVPKDEKLLAKKSVS